MMRVTFLFLFLFAFSPLHVWAANILHGDTECLWGSLDCNPCVGDVVGNFENISDNNGDHTGGIVNRVDSHGLRIDLGAKYHIQGIGRIPNVDQNNWVVFTRSINGEDGSFFVGVMEDMFSDGGHWGDHDYQDDDNRYMAGNYQLSTFGPDYLVSNHYSGLQMVGQYMVAAIECWPSNQIHCLAEPEVSHIYDLSDPLNPTWVNTIDRSGQGVGMARLEGGGYIAYFHDGGFSVSDQDDLDASTTWTHVGSFAGIDDGGAGDDLMGNFQNVSLVTECSTRYVYMIGTYRNGGGEDYAELFRIEQDSVSENYYAHKVASKHMYCQNQKCDFSASGNLYITPEKNMVLYASHLDDLDDFFGFGSQDIPFTEFQNALNLCNDPENPTCDYDQDGLTNEEEQILGTNIYDWDVDGDGRPDGSDGCPFDRNMHAYDRDHDGIEDACDDDDDGDGVLDGDDNCWFVANADQLDLDGDGYGDACDYDANGNGVRDDLDMKIIWPVLELLLLDE